MYGTIFSIEDFAINDGPGIRTVVFLKGCPLRCQWCHNPEGQSFEPQVLRGKNGEETLCGEKISASALAEKILRDEKIFAMNGGGVTFTGGEPLAQADFLLEVLSLIVPRVHAAVETSAYAPAETFAKVARAANLILIDSKSLDPETHKKYTGVGNGQILENLKTLCSGDTDFIVRVPLIPGVNDSRENMRALSDFLRDAPRLKRVELLRYHKTAGAKYRMAGMEYKPDFDVNAEPKVWDEFTRNNIKYKVL
ncbi:MAG: glycyl-radical enzyme activating protein [Opitutales bacterium]|nr:glycyl-radical enzyme activating protein [Opitutales bacterium]